MERLITVTGATGRTGRPLVELLLSRGHRVRAVARESDRLRELAAKGAEPWAGEVGDSAFLTEALRDVDAGFIMIPQRYDVPDYYADQRRMLASIDGAVRHSGVRNIVALSAVGARLRTGVSAALGDLEESLEKIPNVSVVVLRSMFFMDNLLGAIAPIRQAGINGGATRGDLSLPMIATRDVAAVAADLLSSLDFSGYSVRELVGPRPYTNHEATSILGEAIGMPNLPYVEFPVQGIREQMIASGFSESSADAFVAMFEALNDGRIQSTIDPERTSVTSTTLEEFARTVFARAFESS